jgi:hypothetical protein
MKDDEHRLYLTFHHIIFDGVSVSRVFMPELTAIYKAFERGDPLLSLLLRFSMGITPFGENAT